MELIKRVLVTGSNGYIGSLLVPLLKNAGYHVIGLDIGYFDDPECLFKKMVLPDSFIKKDLRKITEEDLKGVDAICHLAALSNDPMGAINPDLTFAINLQASEKLAALAKKSGVKRLLFSSSCSIYGALGDAKITEETPTAPVTAYAISKVKFEKSLLDLTSDDFSPVILRNATAYGSSPKLRLDLVLNNLAAGAFTNGEIKIMSDGTPWRPMIHAEDIARLFGAFLKAPKETVHAQMVNCGRNEENFQVREIAETVHAVFPDNQISFSKTPDKDSRTYRVSFDKLKKLLPDFQFQWTLMDSAKELLKDFQTYNLPSGILEKRDFIRLRQIQYLLQSGRVTQDLFWK